MQEFLRQYMTTHGYWVLFIWTFLEGEAGLILAGFLAYQGYFTVPGVMAVACGGAFCGDQFYFYLGRLKGRLIAGLSHSFIKKIRKGLKLIEKHGTMVAFTSRYTYGFRIILPISLGMTPFSGKRFAWLNALSALSWAIIFTIAGYFFGMSAEYFVGTNTKRYEHYLLITLALIIFLAWLVQFYRVWKRKKPARERLKRLRARM